MTKEKKIYHAKPVADDSVEDIRRDIGLEPTKHPSPEFHIVDERWSTKPAPEGFNEWFTDLRKNHRAYKRIIAELESVKFSSNAVNLCANCKTPDQCKDEKDAGFSFDVRIAVFESCFQAYLCSTSESLTATKEKQRLLLKKEAETILREIKSLNRSLKAMPLALNRLIPVLLTEPLAEKGLKIRRIDNTDKKFIPAEKTLFNILDSLEEGFSFLEENKDKLMEFYSRAGPVLLNVILTEHYMCFGFAGKKNFTTANTLDIECALTIQLSKIFREVSSNEYKQAPKLRDLAHWGKPFYKQAATIALCAIRKNTPLAGDVKRVEESAKTFIRRNPDVSIFEKWE